MPVLVAPEALDAVLQEHLSSQRLSGHSLAASEILRKKIFSKFSDGAPTQKSMDFALNKFLENSLRVKRFEISPSDMLDEYLLGAFRHRCREFFDGIDPADFSLPSLHQVGGVGPGSSIGCRGTDFLRKLYYGPVSATSVDVLHAFYRACASNPLDLLAAKRGAEIFGTVVSNCSRLSFVEKNVDESRTIATEPSVNMYFQLAIGEVINSRLSRVYGYSKSLTPWVNRGKAFLGSVDSSFATIDLQSASDSISMPLCKWALPGYIYEMLVLFRCEYSRLPDGRVIRLPMVSTMGNGWTFSLMTALLYCAVHAVCDVIGDSSDIKHCSVFGDDIVVPSSLYRGVTRLLDALGFVVNTGKSYNEGTFRESCGFDYLSGRFIRPVYIRRLDTENSLYVAFNRLAEWGAFHSVDLYPVLKLLAKSCSEPLWVPPYDDMSSGFRVPSLLADGVFKLKRGITHYYGLSAVPLDYDVAEDPTRVRSLDPRVNPEGVFVAFIGGYLRNGKISERSVEKVHYRLSKRATPYWDFRGNDPCPGWDKAAERRWRANVWCALEGSKPYKRIRKGARRT